MSTRKSSEEWPVGRPADTEAEDPDRVALDELLRAFAIDASRVAEEDRTDSEIDRRVDQVLGDATPDGPEPGSTGEASIPDGSMARGPSRPTAEADRNGAPPPTSRTRPTTLPTPPHAGPPSAGELPARRMSRGTSR